MTKPREPGFFYKSCIVRNEMYLQIWKKVEGKPPIYMASVGSAENLFKILVEKGLIKMDALDETTKKDVTPTKLYEEPDEGADYKDRDLYNP